MLQTIEEDILFAGLCEGLPDQRWPIEKRRKAVPFFQSATAACADFCRPPLVFLGMIVFYPNRELQTDIREYSRPVLPNCSQSLPFENVEARHCSLFMPMHF